MNETTTTDRPLSQTNDPPGTTDVAKDQAKDLASTAAGQARDVTETARQQVEVVASEAKDHAQHLARRTKEELRAQADERATQFSNSLRDVGSQLRSLANGNAQEGMVADLSRDLGHRVQGFADRIDQGGFDGVIDDVRRMARRRPGMFLAGAAAAGFVAARLFRDLQEVQGEGDRAHLTNGHDESYRPPATAGMSTGTMPTGTSTTPSGSSTMPAGSSTMPTVGSVDPASGPAVMPLADSGLSGTPNVPPPMRPDGAS